MIDWAIAMPSKLLSASIACSSRSTDYRFILQRVPPAARNLQQRAMIAHLEDRKLGPALFVILRAFHSEAEAMLLHSLKLAHRQDAKAWQLRTATSLASFYVRLGRIHDARAVLEPTLKQFEQGHDTRDFQAAVSVLSALSS